MKSLRPILRKLWPILGKKCAFGSFFCKIYAFHIFRVGTLLVMASELFRAYLILTIDPSRVHNHQNFGSRPPKQKVPQGVLKYPFAGFEKAFLTCNFVPIGPSVDLIAPAYHNLTMLSRMEVNSSL